MEDELVNKPVEPLNDEKGLTEEKEAKMEEIEDNEEGLEIKTEEGLKKITDTIERLEISDLNSQTVFQTINSINFQKLEILAATSTWNSKSRIPATTNSPSVSWPGRNPFPEPRTSASTTPTGSALNSTITTKTRNWSSSSPA